MANLLYLCMYVCMYVSMYEVIRRPHIHHIARTRNAINKVATLNNAHQRNQAKKKSGLSN